jgi:hypothetical protein
MMKDDPDLLAWDWFLLLNSPITGPAPKWWERWKQTSTVYLPGGAKPMPWGQNPPVPPAVLNAAKQQGLDLNKPFHNLDTAIQVDGLTLSDTFRQQVRYQLLMNQDTFTYILDNGLYNVNSQEQRAKDNKPLDFPAPSAELKTSWIWIGADMDILTKFTGKYYIVNAYYLDKAGQFQVGLAALTGMHIINKLLPQWVWITFENVHNAEFTKAKLELPIPAKVQQINASMRQALANEKSILENYQLIGIQYQFTDSHNKDTLLANSNIESAFQKTSSCITCHSLASYSVNKGYFNIVKARDGGILYYTGNPPSDALKAYTTLDFVWSLKRAHRAK